MKLMVPETFSTYRVMGIDPGLGNLGVSFMNVDSYTHQILTVEAYTLVNDKMPDYSGLEEDIYSARTVKLYKLKYALMQLLHIYQPSIVACEAPFFNRLRPMAYGALLELVSCLHATVIDYNRNLGFISLPPLTVKKFIGAKSIKNDTDKGKSVVKEAIRLIPEIMNVLTQDIDTLSEHAIDAIGVGYTLIKQGV